jgi:tRNA A-37 threonylcarbamoyl transferase component Bud32
MTDLIGKDLGRYHIVAQLGEGGMATVFKAYDVAIKIIRRDAFPPSQLEQVLKRFDREAKSLAKLTHPNIVSIIDYGDFDGMPYLVMPYLPGGTLKRYLGKPIQWQNAIHMLLPIARALQFAHEQNIIHRDVKPSNILITTSGEPMLTDFGIAKILDLQAGQTLTASGVGIGTPEYMSPEQGLGRPVDGRTDIYSLGVVFYELVTGRTPHVADTPMAVVEKHLHDPLPSPRQFVQDLPEEVEKVLMKALAKQPEERYQSMGELEAALEALTKGTTLTDIEVSSPRDEATLYAGVRPDQAAQPPIPQPGSAGLPPIQAAPSAVPPGKPPRRPIRWSLWIPVGLAGLLVCGVLAVVAGLLVRGLASPSAPAIPSAQLPTDLPAAATQAPAQPPPPAPAPSATPETPADTLIPEPAPVKVLWDISHGPRTSSDGGEYTPESLYWPLILGLAGQDFQDFLVTSTGLDDLNNYDILVLAATSATQKAYSQAEADAIEQFVRAGHGLLILSDIPDFGNLANSVGGRFGINFGNVTSDGPTSYLDAPFFSNINAVNFLFGGGTFQVSTPSQIAARDQDGHAVIAFCECNPGRVVAIGDSNLWDARGLDQADNQRFASNVFNWLAGRNP